MSKRIVFSISKAMTIILATVFTMLLLVGCPSAEDKLAVDKPTDLEEEGSGGNTDIPAEGTGSNNEENIEKPEAGTEYDDVENNLRYIVNDDRTLSVKEPIDSELADKVCIPEKYKGIKVTSIENGAFYYCYSLTSIDIPDTVTSIGDNAFIGCSGLTSITVSDNNKYYMSIDGVLFDKNVQKIIAYPCSKSSNYYTIPDSITSIEDSAFRDCSSLKSITIPDTVTSIGDYAFYGCSSLTSIIIPNSVTSIGDYAFFYCTSLTSITVSDSNMYYKSIDGVLFDKNVQKIIAYPCGKSSNYYTIPDSVTSIGSYAFYNCKSLTSFTIPDSVTSIGNFAFNGCTGLTSITVSDNNKYYKSINGVLFDKNVQKIIAYPCSKSSNCYTIPDSVTSIGRYAFNGCTGLTSITIPNSVTSIGDDAFFYCTSLTSITIPDSVNSIGGYTFEGCSNLKSITIPDSITSIGDYAFWNCNSLTSITIPNSVTSIGYGAFSGCFSLTSININQTKGTISGSPWGAPGGPSIVKWQG